MCFSFLGRLAKFLNSLNLYCDRGRRTRNHNAVFSFYLKRLTLTNYRKCHIVSEGSGTFCKKRRDCVLSDILHDCRRTWDNATFSRCVCVLSWVLCFCLVWCSGRAQQGIVWLNCSLVQALQMFVSREQFSQSSEGYFYFELHKVAVFNTWILYF